MLTRLLFVTALLALTAFGCEKTKPTTKAHEHKHDDHGHDHEEGDHQHKKK